MHNIICLYEDVYICIIHVCVLVYMYTHFTVIIKSSVLFCSVLFCSVLFCSVLFCSVLFCSVSFYAIGYLYIKPREHGDCIMYVPK